MRRKAVWTACGFALAAGLVVASCGGGSSPTAPSNPGGGGGGGGAANTITIGSNGQVSPANITVSVGSRVTFVNNHNRPHDMSSDPHPDHTDCPSVTVGNLQPGQSRETQNLTTARTCGFHDHNEPSTTGLQGTIRIQ